FKNGTRSFVIEKVQAAGSPQKVLDNKNNCIEVMTGAVLPANTNAVIPYEQCEIAGGIATVNPVEVLLMQNVHQQGVDSKKDEKLVYKRQQITPAITGILASV